ncbi:MAG: GNAT family N-acetyltransferase [Acidobacteria bacterium]|nr:GNAT family N-acetyltransferase [Acidobacteriota bacterium]
MAYEVIDIRQFDSRALEHLLDAEAQAWNLDLRWDYSSSRRMIANCLDEKRISGYAVKDQGGTSGYSFFFYEEGKGLIGNLFVEGSRDHLERAHLLLRHVLETLLATPGLVRVETQLPHYSFEALEPLFREHGFEGHLRRFMVMSLPRPRWTPYGSGSSGAGKPTLRDFRILPWERRHDSGVAQVIHSAYRNHIDAQINDQYATLEGTARLVESILQQRGCGELLPTASLVAIHAPTGKLAAALAVTAVRTRTAHIPQIAVATEFQNHGIGSALLETSFQDLTKNRFEEVSLTVTDRNGGAVRLYESMDFLTFRTFGAFTWGNVPQL